MTATHFGFSDISLSMQHEIRLQVLSTMYVRNICFARLSLLCVSTVTCMTTLIWCSKRSMHDIHSMENHNT